MPAAVPFNRHSIRQLSAVLLMVWGLLAVAGLAQACVTRVVTAHAPAAADCEQHAPSAADDAQPSPADKLVCQKVCAEVPAPASKHPGTPSDLGAQPVTEAALPVQAWRFDAAPVTPLAAAVASPDPPRPGRPLSIVLGRLTL